MPRSENFISRLKTLTGVTSSELTIVFTILLGLIIGTIVREVSGTEDKRTVNKEVFRVLDSLAEASKLTYGQIKNDESKLSENNNINESEKIEETAQFSFLAKRKRSTKAEKIKGKKFNINTASKKDLMKLPGIGEKTADKIIEYRNKRKFTKISDIKKVKGIGVKKFEAMKEFIEVK